jgi:hypothetical protein
MFEDPLKDVSLHDCCLPTSEIIEQDGKLVYRDNPQIEVLDNGIGKVRIIVTEDGKPQECSGEVVYLEEMGGIAIRTTVYVGAASFMAYVRPDSHGSAYMATCHEDGSPGEVRLFEQYRGYRLTDVNGQVFLITLIINKKACINTSDSLSSYDAEVFEFFP